MRYVLNQTTKLTDPSGLSGEGHHWIPVAVSSRLFEEKLITKTEFEYFGGRRSGGLAIPHAWHSVYNGVSHQAYNMEVESQLRAWKSDPKSYLITDEQVVDNIRDGRAWNGEYNDILDKFNTKVKNNIKNPGTPSRPNRFDIDTHENIRKKGITSLQSRGKYLAMAGAMGSIVSGLDAKAKADSVNIVLTTGLAITKAKTAMASQDYERFKMLVIGRAYPQPSVYEELQNVDLRIAEAFRIAAELAIEQLDKEMENLSGK